MKMLKPSTPRMMLWLESENHDISSINWKLAIFESKKTNSKIEKLNIKRDQNSEKFLIKNSCVFSIKSSKKTPINGSMIKFESNIIYFCR
jgi:hypothetical protein